MLLRTAQLTLDMSGDISRPWLLSPVRLGRRHLLYGHPYTPGSLVDTSRFDEFTHELVASHVACEPDAFGVYRGGQGTPIKIGRGPLTQRGTLVEPVNIATRRWLVERRFGRTLWVPRAHIRKDSRRWVNQYGRIHAGDSLAYDMSAYDTWRISRLDMSVSETDVSDDSSEISHAASLALRAIGN